MKDNVAKLLRKMRKQSGYGSFHIWEPGSDHGSDNPNYPFKPGLVSGGECGQPWQDALSDRADQWDGSFLDWDSAVKAARVGHCIDFYVTKVGDELITNIEVWVKSENEIIWSDCGGKAHITT